MCSLRDANEKLKKLGVTIFGVSRDKVATQASFATDQKLPFTLLADVDGEVMEAFGVPPLGPIKLASRQAYLFKDGKLVWRDLKASTEEQADDVLAALAELQKE